MTRFLGDLDLSSTSRMSKADMQTPNIILYGGIALGLFLRVVAWLQDVFSRQLMASPKVHWPI